MQIFGLAFILYYLKWSDGSGFWENYRNSDEDSYKQAVKIQRLEKKLVRCELAIQFMTKCRDANVFPKFTRWKNTNTKAIKDRNRYRRKVLVDEIRDKHQQLRKMKDDLQTEASKLYDGMPFMRKWMIKKSIHNIMEVEKTLVRKRHDKKFGNLLDEKAKLEGTEKNPNKTIWNFSSHDLTNDEHETLRFGLRHGIAKQPDEN